LSKKILPQKPMYYKLEFIENLYTASYTETGCSYTELISREQQVRYKAFARSSREKSLVEVLVT
jgi:hypothetical protein